MADPLPLYFLHIPKTAGTTVWSVLLELSRHQRRTALGLCLLDDLPAGAEGAAWTEVDLLGGHLGRLPIELRPGLQVVTVLRHPAQHLHSWFRHVQREPGHYLHQLVVSERITFDQWLCDPRFAPLVDNPQARHLGTAPAAPPEHRDAGDPTRHQREFDLAATRPGDEALLDAAAATLRSCRAVGISEDVPAFVRRLAAAFGTTPPPIPHLNADPSGGWVPDAPTLTALRRRCPLDFELYELASSLAAAR